MQEYIGEYGTVEGAKEILEGKYDPNWFEHLSAVNYLIKNNLWQVVVADLVDIYLIVEELK
eukprot:13965282-Ditylum_brightwellii.AAC.1